MNEKRRVLARWVGLALMLVLVAIGGAAAAKASSGGPYEVTWSTIDGGGGTSASDGYRVEGTAGQPDPGGMMGSGYRLVGGFWGGGAVRYEVYLPVVARE